MGPTRRQPGDAFSYHCGQPLHCHDYRSQQPFYIATRKFDIRALFKTLERLLNTDLKSFIHAL